MKIIIRILFALLLSVNAHAQFTAVGILTGSAVYGTTTVTVTSAGSVSSATSCGAGPYYIGTPSGAGSYTFTFSPAVNGIRLHIAAMDLIGAVAETLHVAVNGSAYALTPSNFSPWGGSGCALLSPSVIGGSLVTTASGGSGGVINILDCGMTSVTISTNGVNNGLTFGLAFSDTAGCFNASNNGPLCPGSVIDLFSSGPNTGTFSWTGPGGFTSTLQNPVVGVATSTDTGTYRVIHNGVDTSYTTVTLLASPPIPTIPVIFPQCSQTTLGLTAADSDDPVVSYQWTGPNGFSSTLQTTTIDSIPTSGTGFYSVTVVEGGCPSLPAIVHVLIDSTPVKPVVGNNTPLCSGNTLILTASDVSTGVTFSWAGPASYTSSLANNTITNSQTYMTGYYTVTATNGICHSSSFDTVIINQTPVITLATSNSPVCSGGTLILQATGMPGTGNFYWTGPNGFSSSITPTPSVFFATGLASGMYSVHETLNGCTSPLDSTLVYIPPTPPPPIPWSNGTVCENDTIMLFSNDSATGVTYHWSGPNGFTSSLQNPTIYPAPIAASGVYTVTVAIGYCADSAIIGANVSPAPALTVGSNSPACTGDTLKLFATSSPGVAFMWDGPFTFFSPSPSPIRFPVVPEFAGMYHVTATSAAGCTSYGQDSVIIHESPAPPWVGWLTYCQYYDAPPLGTVDAVNITWYPTHVGSPGVTVAPIPATNVPGVYFWYLDQTINGCKSPKDSVQIIVNPKPILTLTPTDSKICPHTEIDYVGTDNGPFDTYRWFPSLYIQDSTALSTKAFPVASISYSLVASNLYGCSDTAFANVTVYPAGVMDIFSQDTIVVYPGQSVQMAPQTNCSTVEWFPTFGVSDVNASNPTITPPSNGLYAISGVTEYGCAVSDSIYFKIDNETHYSLPNAFVPGNGPNNRFKLLKEGMASLNYFRIFDRWGVMVYESTNIDEGWDGNYKGKPQPGGVYVYDVSAVSTFTNRVFQVHGNVTLMR